VIGKRDVSFLDDKTQEHFGILPYLNPLQQK